MKYLLLLLFIYGCSKGGGGGASNKSSPVVPIKDPLETQMYGTYQALLAPINKTVSGHINGALTLARDKNEFIADVRFSGGPPSILHTQNVHVGNRCPTEKDDLNKDGYIDAEEGNLVFQGILIPLDDDISSWRMGGGIYPAADEFGYYYYSKATDYNLLIEDLREDDINPDDDFIKLPANKTFNVTEMVVVIAGVSESIILPDSVSGRGRLTKHQGLPIACGVIRKLTTTPGVIDNDYTGIPLPEGETIGGSSGADDGADFNSDPSTGSTGNYGEDEVEEDESLGGI